mgnify:CR=1 FL=1
MSLRSLFRMPTPIKITGRTSSITNAFINSIIPTIEPTEEQISEALSILDMDESSFSCSYCGDTASEWDHFRPLVKNKKPTGYISEIHNLVPACGKCNQSKGNRDWKSWMLSAAALSPKTRGIPDLDDRIARLEAYEKWGSASRLDLEQLVSPEDWEGHWANWEEILKMMKCDNSDPIWQTVSEQVKTNAQIAAKRT